MVRVCLVVLAMVLGVVRAYGQRFEPVGELKNATALTMGEDGAHVFAAHEGDNKISVVDVKTGKVVKEVACEAPAALLVRGTVLVAASREKGTVRVFDGTREWQETKTIETGEGTINILSAPRGEAFADVVLATGGAKREERKVYAIDLKAGTSKVVRGPGPNHAAMVSADGWYVLHQGGLTGANPDGSRGASWGVFDHAVYMGGEKAGGEKGAAPLWWGKGDLPAVLEQVHAGIWFTDREVYAGMPPYPLRAPRQTMVIPDHRLPVVYDISRGVRTGFTLKAYALDAMSTVLAEVRVEASGVTGFNQSVDWRRPEAVRLRTPVAATHEGTTYLFAIGVRDRQLQRCVVRGLARGEDEAGGQGQIRFSVLPTPLPTTGVALSEDGRQLAALHERHNAVTVWHVELRRQNTRLAVASPSAAVWRDGNLYVASRDAGTIEVFESQRNWRHGDQIRVGGAPVTELLAAKGEAFQGQVVALLGGKGSARLVDVKNDKSTELRYQSLTGVVDRSGRFAGFPVSYSVEGVTWNAGPVGIPVANGRLSAGDALASAAGGYYHTSTQLYYGRESLLRHGSLGSWLAADATERVIYAYNDGLLRAHYLNPALDQAEQRAMALPAWMARHFRSPNVAEYLAYEGVHYQPWQGSQVLQDGRRVNVQPMGAKDGIHLHFVALDAQSGHVYLATTREMTHVGPRSGVTDPAGEERPRLAYLPGAANAESMALTEDGAFLVLAHEYLDKVSVWDVRTGRPAGWVTVPAPRQVLCRGERAYVLSAGHGTIEVVERVQKEWKKTRTVKLGEPGAYHMAAAQGKRFSGTLIVSAIVMKRWRMGLLVVHADGEGEVQQVQGDRFWSFVETDYTGEHLINVPERKSGGQLQQLKLADVLGKSDALGGRPLGYGQAQRQVREAGLWYDGSDVMSGESRKSVGSLITDPAEDILAVALEGKDERALVLTQNGVRLVDVHDGMQVRSAWDVHVAAELRPDEPLGGRGAGTPKPRNVFGPNLPLAVVHDQMAYMFIRDKTGGVHRFAGRIEAQAAKVPAASQPATTPGAFPGEVTVGQRVVHTLPGAGAGTSCELMKGPEGLTLSADGKIEWTPLARDAGAHEIKIRVTRGVEVSIVRLQTQVSAAGRGSGGDLVILRGEYALTPGLEGKSVLLLDGNTLRVLDATGTVETAMLRLQQGYLEVYERGAYYLARREKGIDFLAKETGQVLHAVEVPGEGIISMACDPRMNVTYVSAKRGQNQDHRVFRLQESNRMLMPLDHIKGYSLLMSPEGSRLFGTGVPRVSLGGPGLRIYDLRSGHPVRGAESEAAEFKSVWSVSPDGRFLCQARALGSAMWEVSNLAKPRPLGATQEYRPAAFHPTLPLLAVPEKTRVRMEHAETGAAAMGRLGEETEGLSETDRVLFAPSGTHLLVVSRDQTRRLVLRSMPLRLSDEERKTLSEAGAAVRRNAEAFKEGVPRVVAWDELEGLRKVKPAVGLPGVEVVHDMTAPGVVQLTNMTSAPYGFFVGSNGTILASLAGNLEREDGIKVQYVQGSGVQRKIVEAKARVLLVDQENYVALLKITPEAPVRVLQLSERDGPTKEETLLAYTRLTGDMQNWTWDLAKTKAVPVQAHLTGVFDNRLEKVHSGAGGPVLDQRGRVVGMVATTQHEPMIINVARIRRALEWAEKAGL